MNIFVSIASYRDVNCNTTLQSLYRKAMIPERIFCGILLQNKNQDEDIDLTKIDYKFHNQIRIIRTTYLNARGPLYARQFILDNLYNNEEFYFQIDSHMDFIDNYDQHLLDQLYMTPCFKKSIITYYPNETLDGEMVSVMSETIPYIRFPKIQQIKGILEIPNDLPKRSKYCAAGFFFTYKDIIKYYPKERLEYLFQGEEILLVFKLEKYFNFYSPTMNIASHIYNRKDSPKFWTDHPTEKWSEGEIESLSKLYKILSQ